MFREKRYIALEKLFEYEHSSKFHASAETRAQLIGEIEGEEFHLSPLQGKIMLNEAEEVIEENKGKSLGEIKDLFRKLKGKITGEVINEMFTDLELFISTDPKIPDDNKEYTTTLVPKISVESSREEIIHEISGLAGKSEAALLTLYTYRQMDKIDWLPFIKAAFERNPVCFNDLCNESIQETYERVAALPNLSIYDDKRLALPDEVWNFRRGDGIEKALLMADVIINREMKAEVKINIDLKKVILEYNHHNFEFISSKHFKKTIIISGNNFEIK